MEKIDNIVQAIIYIKTNPAYFDKAILELRVMPEIKAILYYWRIPFDVPSYCFKQYSST
ncbi:hypothetical protein [Candidatus Nitrosocosmicus sp. T]